MSQEGLFINHSCSEYPNSSTPRSVHTRIWQNAVLDQCYQYKLISTKYVLKEKSGCELIHTSVVQPSANATVTEWGTVTYFLFDFPMPHSVHVMCWFAIQSMMSTSCLCLWCALGLSVYKLKASTSHLLSGQTERVSWSVVLHTACNTGMNQTLWIIKMQRV